MGKHALLVAVVATLLAAACTPKGTGPEVTPSALQTTVAPASPVPSTAAASTERPTTTPTQVDPVGVCPDGHYVLTRFSGTGLGSMKLAGTGKDLKVTFSDGTYHMDAGGRSSYALAGAAGLNGELTLKGTIRGTYSGSGDNVSYKVSGADGTATLKAGGQSRTLPMTQVTRTLAPSGQLPTTCNGDRMTIRMDTITLELKQD
jgi:hypothetical protein